MNALLKTGMIAVAVSTLMTAHANAAIDSTPAMAEAEAGTPAGVLQFDVDGLPHFGFEPDATTQIIVAASSTLRKRNTRTPTFRARKKRKIRMPGKLAPNNHGGQTKGPAVINCDIESSEECEKMVICVGNCSTEQMQGDDCC
jgi:hypothetical protein